MVDVLEKTGQDDTLVKDDIRTFERLKSERMPYEAGWRDIDGLFTDGAGGFNAMTPGGVRGAKVFDSTHVTANERFAAAGVAITTPEEKDYIRPRFDDDLMQYRSVQLWCERAGRRLYLIRHAQHTGFGVAANEDWDQLGRYGTSPMWTDVFPDRRGLFYRTLHLSGSYIDVDFAGLVNMHHGHMCKRVGDLADFFGAEALTPKMQKALAEDKYDTEFEVIHIVAPNREWDLDTMDWRRMPIASRWLALDEKIYLRRSGYFTMPVSVSRHSTSPGEKYGRSPAIKKLTTIKGLQAMKGDTLRAGKKAIDPALLFNNDAAVTKMVTKAGGLNPGMVDDAGRVLVHRMPGGEGGIPYAMEMVQDERQEVKDGFLEDFYKILTDPNSRMTTVEVLEVMAKQGVLVRPFANRYATEKQHPVTQRDLDLAMRTGQIDPFPPEVIEAGAWPMIDYENPLAAMARAESTSKTMRFVEVATAINTLAEGPAADVVNVEAALRASAEEIGVRPSLIRDPETVAAIQAKRQQDQQMAQQAEQLTAASGAALDLAKAGQLSEAA
jgi:hypothetical protein